ncbi:hypothetical protein Trydic_g13328 [Trypoxylus dichotomus]
MKLIYFKFPAVAADTPATRLYVKIFPFFYVASTVSICVSVWLLLVLNWFFKMSLRKSVLSRGSKRMSVSTKDFSPTTWPRYFDDKRSINVNGSIFNVYVKGSEGPGIVALHGGGYSGLTWALFAEEITTKINCHILAIDLRGHGLTHTRDDSDLDLTTLANDVNDIINGFYIDEIPPIVLIGHSMGGAVAVEAAHIVENAVGLCVIDVVEGSALESLSAMQNILRGRPTSFPSLEHAIQWSFRSGQTHNLEAARVSVPGQIKNIKTGQLGTHDAELQATTRDDAGSTLRLMHQQSADSIAEVDENDAATTSGTSSNSHEEDSACAINPKVYTWRIDLSKTERFWNGWFKGLSQKFLNLPIPKVLLLANIHGLDTVLTIGQMQGKFQMQVLHKSGHAIHEDQPGNVADIISGFLVKQKITVSKEGFTPIMPAC